MPSTHRREILLAKARLLREGDAAEREASRDLRRAQSVLQLAAGLSGVVMGARGKRRYLLAAVQVARALNGLMGAGR